MTDREVKGNCEYCGMPVTLESTDNKNVWNDVTKHKDWCSKISIAMDRKFNKTYAEIYNVIELALDKEKAKNAKALIGKSIFGTYKRCMEVVANYFNNKL